jgi:hypothetical protein
MNAPQLPKVHTARIRELQAKVEIRLVALMTPTTLLRYSLPPEIDQMYSDGFQINQRKGPRRLLEKGVTNCLELGPGDQNRRRVSYSFLDLQLKVIVPP